MSLSYALPLVAATALLALALGIAIGMRWVPRLNERRPEFETPATVEDAVAGADAVMVLTPWKEFVELDPGAIRGLVNQPVIIDGRNVLDPRRWHDAGWRYFGMGRGVSVW